MGSMGENQAALLQNCLFYETEDGLGLQEIPWQSDLLEIPDELMGIPVVELGVQFCVRREPEADGSIQYAPLPRRLFVGKNLKRIRCPLIGRGLEEITVAPENPHIFCDDTMWYEECGKVLVGRWKKSARDSYIREYYVRNHTTAINASGIDRDLERIYIPDSVKVIASDAFAPGSTTEIFGGRRSRAAIYAMRNHLKYCVLDRPYPDDFTLEERDGKVYVTEYNGENTVVHIPAADPQGRPVVGIRRPEDRRLHLYGGMLPSGYERAKRICLPDSVVEIEAGFFADFIDLKEILVAESNPAFIGVDGVLYTKDMSMLVAYPAALVCERFSVPSTVRTVGEYAFYEQQYLHHVDMPSVERIGSSAFMDCRCLDEVGFSDRLTEICDYAFSGCEFKSITVPPSVRRIGVSAFYKTAQITIYDTVDPEGETQGVGYTGVYLYKNADCAPINCIVAPHRICVRDAKSDQVKLWLSIRGKPEEKRVYFPMIKNWGACGSFDFAASDARFKDMMWKTEYAICRLQHPVGLSARTRSEIAAHLGKTGTKLGRRLIDENMPDIFALCAENGMVTAMNISRLTEHAVEKENSQIVAYLLDYKHRHF